MNKKKKTYVAPETEIINLSVGLQLLSDSCSLESGGGIGDGEEEEFGD